MYIRQNDGTVSVASILVLEYKLYTKYVQADCSAVQCLSEIEQYEENSKEWNL